MSNYNIHTTLDIVSTFDKGRHRCNTYIVVRGASAEFTFDFNLYSYLKPGLNEPWYKYLEQMYFIFKQEGEEPLPPYKLFTARKSEQTFDPEIGPEMTENCKYDPDRDCISLLLTSKDTAAMSSDADNIYEYEIAIEVDTATPESQILVQGKDAVIIEKQSPVTVVDSLYRRVMPELED